MYIGDVTEVRPSSPIFMEVEGVGGVKYPEMRKNGERDNFVHINRIPLIRTAVVNYLYADSPSCIWVRLTNHITDQLIVREPYDLDGVSVKDDAQVYDYFMAPIENRVFGRCRILKIRNEVPRRMQVIFIDEGTKAWLSPDCLAKMDRDLFFHPWQAIAVSLCGAEMKREIKRDGHVPHEWSREECIEFRQVVAEFKLLKTKTVNSSVVRNDYREPIKVELFGLRNEQDREGVSISSLLAARTLGRFIPRRIVNAALFKPDNTLDNEVLDDDDIPPFRRSFPYNWLRTTSHEKEVDSKVSEWDQWSPKVIVIPPLDIHWLDNNGYCDENSEYFVNVEGAHTISPYEFYARPIRRERIAVNGEENQLEADTKSMLNANNLLREKADVLDTFYSLEENRSALDKKEVSTWLNEKFRVYAICACSEDRGMYTGEWQRVEVLKCDDFAEVLFLDSGGCETILPSSLYKIHQQHCKYPPLCMQLCIQGLCDADMQRAAVGEWSDKCKENWRKLLREDVPVGLSILKGLNSTSGSNTSTDKFLPFHRPNVIFVQRVRIHGDEKLITESFRDPALGPGRARADDTKPIEWSYD